MRSSSSSAQQLWLDCETNKSCCLSLAVPSLAHDLLCSLLSGGGLKTFVWKAFFVLLVTLTGLLNKRTPLHAWNGSLEMSPVPDSVLSCSQCDSQGRLYGLGAKQVLLASLFDEISLARTVKTTLLEVWNICDKPIWTQSLFTVIKPSVICVSHLIMQFKHFLSHCLRRSRMGDGTWSVSSWLKS